MKKIFFYLILCFPIFIFFSCKKTPNNLYKIEVDGKYGYIDSLGQEIIKPQYLFASRFREGLALVVTDTILKVNLIDYSKCKNRFDSLMIKFENYNKTDSTITYIYGYIDMRNKLVIAPTLQFTEDYSENVKNYIKEHKMTFSDMIFYNERAWFQDIKTKKYGFINKNGEIIIEPKYISVGSFNDSLASVNFGKSIHDSQWGYINTEGETIINGKYTIANGFSDGLATVVIADYDKQADITKGENISYSFNWLVINKKGNIVSGPFNGLSNELYYYYDGFCNVRKHFFNNTMGWRFIDKKGNFTTDFDLEEITYFNSGYAGVKTNGVYVFIDKTNKIVSDNYENVLPFSDGYAGVKKNGKWGYVDTTFTEVIPYKYDTCTKFINSLAKVIIRSDALVINAYINKKGEIIWQHESFEYKKQKNTSEISGEITMKEGKGIIKKYNK